MKLVNLRMLTLVCFVFGMGLPVATAQCQRSTSSGSQNPSASLTSATPYALNSFSGYSQNTLGANPYSNNGLMAQRAAAEQYHQYAVMRAQSAGIMVRSQMADTKSQRKMIDQASADLRKQREKERAEALAVRQEREAARRTKDYDKERTQLASTRVASVN